MKLDAPAGRFSQGLDNGRPFARAIDRQLDGQHLRIAGGRFDEAQDGTCRNPDRQGRVPPLPDWVLQVVPCSLWIVQGGEACGNPSSLQ
jgi:hypothetical protein